MPQAVAEFAPAKINLALRILGRRADGFHELDSIVAFADVGDRLTLERAERFEIAASGSFARDLPPPTDNIVYRAWKAVAADVRGLPPVRVHIEKNLPVSSGIGGGSANAAAMLRGLIKIFDLDMAAPGLERIALALGADVPVCLRSESCHMRGIGDRITPIGGLGPFHAVLVNPGAAVSTAAVFAKLGLMKGESFGRPSAAGEDWQNDLTSPAIAVQPAIAEVIAAMPGARMSGSGATCFAIFESRGEAVEFAADLKKRHAAWWIRDTTIGG